MLTVGLPSSLKFAIRVRFDAMVNDNACLLVIQIPWPSVQLVKVNPADDWAVIA